MKNTEYKDVFDISEEALSIENKFNIDKQSQINTSYGNSYRGMNHISARLANGAVSGNSDFATLNYFIDAKIVSYNGIDTIVDPESDPDKIKIKEGNFSYYPKSKDQKFAYKVKIYTSTSARKLEEAFKNTIPGDFELLIFVEDNSSDKTNFIFGAVSIGKKLKENLLNNYEEDIEKNENLISYILNSFVEETGYFLEKSFVEELLKNGKAEYPTLKTISIAYTIIDFVSFGTITEASNYGLSKLLDEAIEFINKGKIDDHRWNPKSPKPFDPKFYPIAIEYELDKLDDKKLNKKIRATVQELSDDFKNYDAFFSKLLNITANKQKRTKDLSLNEIVYNTFKQIYQKCRSIIKNLETIDVSDILKTGIRAWNAFICGVWNSLLDAVTSLLDIVKMIINISTSTKELMKNLNTYLPRLVDRVEEALQKFENLDLWQLTLHFLEKAITSASNIDLVHIAYFIGGFCGFIISLIIEVIIGILLTGGILSVEEIIRRLGQELFGFFTTFARGVKKAWQKGAKLFSKAIDEFIHILDAFIDFLKQGKEEMLKMIDDVFDAFKLHSKEVGSSLNMQIPLLGKAEITLYGRLINIFYKGFKTLLIKYADIALVIKQWKKLDPLRSLSKEDIEVMLEWRRKFVGENKTTNVAILKQKVEVNGEIIELEYKAFAGVNAEGFCKSPDQYYIAKQLNMSVEELQLHYTTTDEMGKVMGRFQDSEHRIFAQNDKDLHTLFTRHGKENVRVVENSFKTFFEPCPSCKKQILIRQELYNVEKLTVHAVKKNNFEYAKSNPEFLKAINK